MSSGAGDGDLPTAEKIIEAHDRLEEEYDLKYKGYMTRVPEKKLREGVIEPAAEYEDPYDRAAVLLWRIPSVHVFEDANKRTAWTVARAYLRQNGIEPPVDDDLAQRVVTRAGKLRVEVISKWFRTGEIDRSLFPEH